MYTLLKQKHEWTQIWREYTRIQKSVGVTRFLFRGLVLENELEPSGINITNDQILKFLVIHLAPCPHGLLQIFRNISTNAIALQANGTVIFNFLQKL